MRVTIFIVYGGIHVVVHLDGKIERRKSSPYPEWPPGASLGRLAQAGGGRKTPKSPKKIFHKEKSNKVFFEKNLFFEKSFFREKKFSQKKFETKNPKRNFPEHFFDFLWKNHFLKIIHYHFFL